MKKIRSRTATLLLLFLLVAVAFPMKAAAAGVIDLTCPVSLTVSAAYDDDALTGVSFKLYKVADFSDSGEFHETETVKAYPVILNSETVDSTTAETLAAYLLRDSVSPEDTACSGSDGLASFPSAGKTLLPGIYLLCSEPMTLNGYSYETAPVLVSLPNFDVSAGRYVYDVTAVAKTARTELTEETVSRSVLKLWEGDSSRSRPAQIEVQLLCNGTVYEGVQLTANNGWKYEWKELPALDKDGTANQWTVVETPVSGYTVKITSSGSAYKITNTAKDGSKPTQNHDSKLPQTGVLWWPVPVLLMAGTMFLLLGCKKRYTNGNK